MIEEKDRVPFAIVEFEDSGAIRSANRLFRTYFFESPAIDLARRTASAERMLLELLKVHRREPTDEFERSELGACDMFYPWSSNRFETRPFGAVHYERPVSPDDVYQIPPARHFRYRLFLANDQAKWNTAYIESIAHQIQAVEAVNQIGEAMNTSIRGLMVDAQDGATPGLSYEIRSRRNDMGNVGGDFVFDFPIRSGKKAKHMGRLSMFGDAAADSIVGGLMVRDVGRILRSVCLKPKSVLKDAQGVEAVNLLARHLNERLLAQAGTGSTGVDGIVVMTDYENRELLIAEGQSEIYVFDRNARDVSEIKSYGDMYFDKRPSLPKGFGTLANQSFKSYCHEGLTEDTMLVAFSDGFGDIYREARRDMRDEIISALHSLDVSEDDFEEKLVKRLYRTADIFRLRHRLRLDEVPDDGAAPGRYDDEMVCVFSPLRRNNGA